MSSIKWRIKGIHRSFKETISHKKNECVLTFQSLTHNTHMSTDYAVDVLLEPMFWFVDNFTKSIGKIFVGCVIFLTTLVVVIAYWIGLPFWREKSPLMMVILLIVGNWILMNIIFHYYMGLTTSPGYPPHGSKVVHAASICKKCIAPKPTRTHHCSVCDTCILQMDHHCPWLNNCVGVFNARYFYLYLAFMLLGLLLLIFGGLEIAYVVLWLEDTGGIEAANDPDLVGHPVVMNKSGVFVPVEVLFEYDELLPPRHHQLPTPVLTEAQRIAADPLKSRVVAFLAILIVGTTCALIFLLYTHGKNISRGETSIESHSNKVLKKKFGDEFTNPYNFGAKRNWKIFLGLVDGRTFVRHILFPSAHKPCSDGVTFLTIHNLKEGFTV